MTREEIASSAYPVVFLKKDLIEHKLQRFNATIAAALKKKHCTGLGRASLHRRGAT